MFLPLAIAVGLLAYALEQLKPMTNARNEATSLFGQGLLALTLMAYSGMWDLRRQTIRVSRSTHALSKPPFTVDHRAWGLPLHDWTTASEPQAGSSLLETEAVPGRAMAPALFPPLPRLGSWRAGGGARPSFSAGAPSMVHAPAPSLPRLELPTGKLRPLPARERQ